MGITVNNLASNGKLEEIEPEEITRVKFVHPGTGEGRRLRLVLRDRRMVDVSIAQALIAFRDQIEAHLRQLLPDLKSFDLPNS